MTSVLQVYPSRISITPLRQPKGFGMVEFNKHCHSYVKTEKGTWVDNFKKEKNAFILSKASKRKLFDSINSMFALSKPRKIEMQNKKFIYNFQLGFITLTLPSAQVHCDVDIKNKCLNQLFVELKKHYQVENYVWKAELQANENIHFHIVIDRYIDFQALRRRWNRIINKLGYVDAYQNKMQNLSLSQYHAMRNKSGKIEFSQSAEAYAKGCQSNWKNPNSVDVRNVSSKKDLAIYLGKYISKEVSKSELSDELIERQKTFGRSWARSYSLSNLKYINKYDVSDVLNLIKYLDSVPDKIKKFQDTFYTVYYFQVSQLSEKFKTFHKNFMFNNAKLWDYPVPA